MKRNKQSKAQSAAQKQARQQAEHIHSQLSAAYQRFDLVRDPVLTEACIYEINALRAKYDYALHNLKQLY